MLNFNRAFTEQQGKVLYHPAFDQKPVVNPRQPRRLPQGVVKANFRKQAEGMRVVLRVDLEQGATA